MNTKSLSILFAAGLFLNCGSSCLAASRDSRAPRLAPDAAAYNASRPMEPKNVPDFAQQQEPAPSAGTVLRSDL